MTQLIKREDICKFPEAPAVELFSFPLSVHVGEHRLASTISGLRVVERCKAPVYFFPALDVRMDMLVKNETISLCPERGMAQFYDLVVDGQFYDNAAWSYTAPNPEYAELTGMLAFSARVVDACYVAGERAEPENNQMICGWLSSHQYRTDVVET